jgi:hypothetical protein
MCGAYLRCLSLELEVEIGELENGIGRVESSFLQVAVYKQLGGWKHSCGTSQAFSPTVTVTTSRRVLTTLSNHEFMMDFCF